MKYVYNVFVVLKKKTKSCFCLSLNDTLLIYTFCLFIDKFLCSSRLQAITAPTLINTNSSQWIIANILPDFPRYVSTTNAHTVSVATFMLAVESFLWQCLGKVSRADTGTQERASLYITMFPWLDVSKANSYDTNRVGL